MSLSYRLAFKFTIMICQYHMRTSFYGSNCVLRSENLFLFALVALMRRWHVFVGAWPISKVHSRRVHHSNPVMAGLVSLYVKLQRSSIILSRGHDPGSMVHRL
jgi:hypothetical protein